jgi:hypothetical protein
LLLTQKCASSTRLPTSPSSNQIALANRMLRAFSNSVEALKEGRGLIVLAIEQMDSHGSLSDPTFYPQNNQNVERSTA